MQAPILYELNTRSWLREIAQARFDASGEISNDRSGPPGEGGAHPRILLDEAPVPEIVRLAHFGVTHLWLMGVWDVGPLAREIAIRHWKESWAKEIPSVPADVEGSPFAIADLMFDRRVATSATFLNKVREAGLKVILDFVPNHAGIDHWAMDRSPGFFVQTSPFRPGAFARKTKFGKRWFAHGRDPYFPPWADTVQVDYRNAAAQDFMKEIAARSAMICDGLRCDMAMLVLPEVFENTWKEFPRQIRDEPRDEFWDDLIRRVKERNPEFLFIGEVYWDLEQRLQELGFGYTYHKPVYDMIVRRQFSELREHLAGCRPEFLARSVHFLENHDEPRIASLLPFRLHKAAAVLLLGLPGMMLLHDGQLEGRKAFARIQMTKRVDEEPDLDVRRFYEELLASLHRTHVRSGHPSVLAPGEAEAGNSTWRSFVAVQWRDPVKSEADIVVANLGPEPGRCRLEGSFKSVDSVAFRTGNDDSIAGRSVDGGMLVEMPGESAQILRVQKRH